MVVRRFTTGFLAVLAIGTTAYAQPEKAFPTNAEINLALTQTERAVQLYKPLIDELELKLGDAVKDTAKRDRQVVVALETAVKVFRASPEKFNGPLGFAFFEWVDDAGRNSALCAGNASNEATAAMMLNGNPSEA